MHKLWCKATRYIFVGRLFTAICVCVSESPNTKNSESDRSDLGKRATQLQSGQETSPKRFQNGPKTRLSGLKHLASVKERAKSAKDGGKYPFEKLTPQKMLCTSSALKHSAPIHGCYNKSSCIFSFFEISIRTPACVIC